MLLLNLTVVEVAGMDAFLNEFTLQLKSNALVVTLLFVCFFYANRETNRKIEDANRETNRKIDGMGLTIHSIEKQLPESIVHIVLTPSQASRTKDANLKILLDLLLIDFPKISDCEVKPSKKNFSECKFTWDWGNQPESSVYKPFIEAIRDNLLKLKLEIHDVSGGQLLLDQLLYTTKICNLRVLDDNGRKKGPVYYKGQISGRTDLVVVEYKGEWAYILRHNVRFAIEVKLPFKSPSNLASALREATTQLLGLCCDNPRRSPPGNLLIIITKILIMFNIKYHENISSYQFF